MHSGWEKINSPTTDGHKLDTLMSDPSPRQQQTPSQQPDQIPFDDLQELFLIIRRFSIATSVSCHPDRTDPIQDIQRPILTAHVFRVYRSRHQRLHKQIRLEHSASVRPLVHDFSVFGNIYCHAYLLG